MRLAYKARALYMPSLDKLEKEVVVSKEFKYLRRTV